MVTFSWRRGGKIKGAGGLGTIVVQFRFSLRITVGGRGEKLIPTVDYFFRVGSTVQKVLTISSAVF